MIEIIRVATTADGNIEAALQTPANLFHGPRLVIDRRTGSVLSSSTKEGSDVFRWLVDAARKHKAL